jgi:peroxin-7
VTNGIQWTPDRPRSLMTLQAHHACVYQALFSPHQPEVVATCSTDGSLKIFDLRNPSYAPPSSTTNTFINPLSASALTVPASTTEVLSLDWNKYRPFVLASTGVDKLVKVWDCRMVKLGDAATTVGGICEVSLPGHEYAVRKVQWSPHRPDVLATASYDMTCRMCVLINVCLHFTNYFVFRSWSTSPIPGRGHLLYIHDPHTEFVVGCAWSLYEEGVLATCGWDSRLNIFRSM